MSILDKLATAQNRADEAPNLLLARELAESEDRAAVRLLIDHLADPDRGIQNDCIKVLYEIGALKPFLIADGVDTFIKLLGSRNNRLVWGAMTALGTLAESRAAEIWRQIDVIIKATDEGSVITQDWGIRVLAIVAAQDQAYAARIYPFLLGFLRRCPAKDLPRHAESVLVAVDVANRADLLAILERRKGSLTAAGEKRVDGLIGKIRALI
jgi:hypothetical protein